MAGERRDELGKLRGCEQREERGEGIPKFGLWNFGIAFGARCYTETGDPLPDFLSRYAKSNPPIPISA